MFSENYILSVMFLLMTMAFPGLGFTNILFGLLLTPSSVVFVVPISPLSLGVSTVVREHLWFLLLHMNTGRSMMIVQNKRRSFRRVKILNVAILPIVESSSDLMVCSSWGRIKVIFIVFFE